EPLQLTPGLSERDILDKMVREYKAAESYGDHGEFIVELTDKQQEPFSWPCTFAYEKPNLVRMEIADGKMISNGEFFTALIPQLYGQVLRIPAPKVLSIGTLYPDMNLAGAMDLRIPGDLFWVPPQILLLFAKDPLKTLVPEGSKVSFDKPAWIGETPCDRIKIENSSGTQTFWIDRKTFVLMRIDLPVERFPASEGRTVARVRLELDNATLNPDIEGEAFTIEYPENLKIVENFTPWPVLLQGKKLNDFDSITINSFAGKSIPLSQYADKVVVLQFWSATNSYCAEAMREIYAVYEKMKSDVRVRFVGVCFDSEEEVSMDAAIKVLNDWQAPLPSCRLPDFKLPESLQLFVSPNLVILAPGGVVARYFPPGPNSEQEILDAVHEVLDGKIGDPALADALKEQREYYAQTMQAFIDSDYFAVSTNGMMFEENVPIAPRKLPNNTIKFRERAVISELKNPGNILVVPREKTGEEPLFLVPFQQNEIALFDGYGKIVNRYKPKSVLSSESITLVRTAVDSRGQRIFVASAPITNGGNRIHIFDEQFESLGFYPQTQADAEALVMTDVRLVDLDGDGDPEIVISALDLSQSAVGSGFVRAIKLDGTLLWENTKIMSPYQLGVALSENQPSILAMNASQNMTLFEFDPQGNLKREISLKDGNPIGWFVVADLEGKGYSRICASVPHKDERNVVHIAEIDRSGNQDWQYPFLVAVHTVPLEYLVAADVVGNATKEWIFASADGTLHILSNKGKPLDHYSHGKIIAGFNAAPIAGQKVLAVADSESITIYGVE
ncbi:MAG: redoxin domain-containing protein, partial [Planctomycetaceae bacterium]|nr:redoxin domain-containing protein [Planctomycetaceae bacterium]